MAEMNRTSPVTTSSSMNMGSMSKTRGIGKTSRPHSVRAPPPENVPEGNAHHGEAYVRGLP